MQHQDELNMRYLNENVRPSLSPSKARLTPFENQQEEIVSLLDGRLGSRLKSETIAAAHGAKVTRADDPMGVNAVAVKVKLKGKSQGKFGKEEEERRKR